MSEKMKSLVARALAGEAVERPPVWMMRQAGRYLPEYRALKERHGFLGLCKTPELALEITMQPMRFLDPDAAILFADILLPAECIGIEVDFAPGPMVLNPIEHPDRIAALTPRDVASTLGYVFKAVSLIRSELDRTFGGGRKALFGFAGAPWTMACYLIAQPPYKHFQGTQVFAAQHPQALATLLTRLSDITIEYLRGQIDHGADVVQLFDSWGGNLSEEDYRRYSLPYIRRIIEGLKGTGCPVVLYVNGSAHLLDALLESGADCISVDWRTPLAAAFTAADGRTAVQGNFDPTHLFGTAEQIAAETSRMLAEVPVGARYLANLGHGILPGTPPGNVRAFVQAVKQFRR